MRSKQTEFKVIIHEIKANKINIKMVPSFYPVLLRYQVQYSSSRDVQLHVWLPSESCHCKGVQPSLQPVNNQHIACITLL